MAMVAVTVTIFVITPFSKSPLLMKNAAFCTAKENILRLAKNRKTGSIKQKLKFDISSIYIIMR